MNILPLHCATTSKNIVRSTGDYKWASLDLDSLVYLDSPDLALMVQVYKVGSAEPEYSSIVYHRSTSLSASPIARKLRTSYEKVIGQPNLTSPKRYPLPLRVKHGFRTQTLSVASSNRPYIQQGKLVVRARNVIDVGMVRYVQFGIDIGGTFSKDYYAILFARCHRDTTSDTPVPSLPN
jgi:hypothetical protein